MAFIYKITNLQNNKIYIGQTSTTLDRRFRQHQIAAFTLKLKRPLYSAMRKYGIENFKIELVEEVDADKVADAEQLYISRYESFAPLGKGYNATRGGEGAILLDYDLIYQLWRDGKSIAEISTITGATRYSIRGVLKVLPDYNETESRRRGNRYQHSLRLKTIYQYAPDGTYLMTYDSVATAAESLNISTKSLFFALTVPGQLAAETQWSYLRLDKLSPIEHKVRKYKQPVLEIDSNGKVIAEYESASAAAKLLSLDSGYIRTACTRDSHKYAKLDRYFIYKQKN